jgi:putative nucleotidyltransferase with HDIG domain
MVDENIGGVDEQTKEGLQQLLDSTYPLLQKFREACPGTYKHSQSVASMVEGVAMVLGLDVTRMKIMALYHDVGKMFGPTYFTENQLDDMVEPHESLDPIVSYGLITKHVSDSAVILLNDHNFPRDIIEIICQHHGQCVLKYFYTKSGSKDKNAFRYKTAKPACVESAVLIICDQIEATSRSLVQSNKFNATLVIESTISGLIDDGQLDEVMMRLGDLKKIKEALAKELEGTYQKRVDYDKAKEEKHDIE